jgi:hypothetical protein
LIGCAYFERDSLRVEQWLLERPGLERPMLARLAALLAQASGVVSFNGKSFDWPLLRTRFILQRTAAPRLPAHLDLLHCARRVYKRRLGSVRLVQLEQSLLGFERHGDLPGELIPETYLGFLRGRTSGAALWPVVEHNRSDLVALPALLGQLARSFSDVEGWGTARARGPDPREPGSDAGPQATVEVPRPHACDQLGFAQVAARADDRARALALAEAVSAVEPRDDARGTAYAMREVLAAEAAYLAGLLKLKDGDLVGACEALARCVALAGAQTSLAARAHLVLAKLFEHKLGDPRRALVHARHTLPAEGEDAWVRRQQRLERRAQ